MLSDNSAKRGETSDQQEYTYRHPGQATLFPEDPSLQGDEDGLRPLHYLMGAVLVAAMLGVLGVGYYYHTAMKSLSPKADEAAPATSSALPLSQPASPPAPAEAPKAVPAPAAVQHPPAAVAMAKKPEAAAPGPAPVKKADKPAPAAMPKQKAEKPAATAAAKPQAAAGGETVYFLQLAAFKDPQDTAKLCRQVEPLGFQCYFGTVDTAAGRYWRLRIGPYDAQGKAEADLAKLKGKGLDGRLIPLKKSVVRAPIQLPGK